MKRDNNLFFPLLSTITRQALPDLISYQSIPEDRTLNDPYSVVDGLEKPEKRVLKKKAYFTNNHVARSNEDSEATSNCYEANIDTATRDSTKARSEASTQDYPPLPTIRRTLVPPGLKLGPKDKKTPPQEGQVTKNSDTQKIRAQHKPSFSDDEENQCPANTSKLSHTPTSRHPAVIFSMQSNGKDGKTRGLTSTTKKNMVQPKAFHLRKF